MTNFIREINGLANNLKGLGKPAILLIGFLGFAYSLNNMDDTSVNTEEDVVALDNSNSELS